MLTSAQKHMNTFEDEGFLLYYKEGLNKMYGSMEKTYHTRINLHTIAYVNGQL